MTSKLSATHLELLKDLDDVSEASLHELGYAAGVAKPLVAGGLIVLAKEVNRAVDCRFRITPKGRALVLEHRAVQAADQAFG